MKTIILCGALKDASAGRITLVAPYYPFARQDRKTTSRSPITTKYLARIFQTMWVDRLLTIDVHNPTAIQNAFHIPCDLLEANNLFAQYIKGLVQKEDIDPRSLSVLSPDAGGLGRARKFRKLLSDKLHEDVRIACLDKVHQGHEITGYDIMGQVKDKNVIIYDDMISSAKTVSECARACFPINEEGKPNKEKWANSVLGVCATHGLFVGGANEHLSSHNLPRIIVGDTIKPFRLKPEIMEKVVVINTTELFAEAIARIHQSESISDLLTNGQKFSEKN